MRVAHPASVHGHSPANRRSASMNGTARKMHAGDERGDGDRDPDLLAPLLDRLDELALHVAADGARLLGDEAAEVAGLAVEGEDGDQPVERRRRRRAPPTRAARRPRTGPGGCGRTTRARSRPHAPRPRGGEAVEGGAERVAGRQQHAELLGDDRQLEEDAPLPARRRAGDLLLERRGRPSSGAPSDEAAGASAGGSAAASDDQRAGAERGRRSSRPGAPGTRSTSSVGVDALEADGELLADAERAGPAARRSCAASGADRRRGTTRPTAARAGAPAAASPPGAYGRQPLGAADGGGTTAARRAASVAPTHERPSAERRRTSVASTAVTRRTPAPPRAAA